MVKHPVLLRAIWEPDIAALIDGNAFPDWHGGHAWRRRRVSRRFSRGQDNVRKPVALVLTVTNCVSRIVEHEVFTPRKSGVMV